MRCFYLCTAWWVPRQGGFLPSLDPAGRRDGRFRSRRSTKARTKAHPGRDTPSGARTPPEPTSKSSTGSAAPAVCQEGKIFHKNKKPRDSPCSHPLEGASSGAAHRPAQPRLSTTFLPPGHCGKKCPAPLGTPPRTPDPQPAVPRPGRALTGSAELSLGALAGAAAALGLCAGPSARPWPAAVSSRPQRHRPLSPPATATSHPRCRARAQPAAPNVTAKSPAVRRRPVSPAKSPCCGKGSPGTRAPLVCAGRCASSGGSVPHARCQAMPVIAFQGGNVAPPVPPAVVSCLAQGTPVPPGPAASQPPPPAPNHPKSAQITPSLLMAGKCPSLTLCRSLRRDERPDLGPPGPA